MAAVNEDRLKSLLLEMVQIDSHSRKERELALRLKGELEAAGASCEFDSAGEKVGGTIGNLIGHLPGTAEGVAPILLCAHMDTVEPGQGVRPIVEGAIIRSDGNTVLGGDDKSGCAIICEILHQLREQKLAHGPIDIIFTICEEIGLLGAKHLDIGRISARQGLVFDSDSSSSLFVRGPGAQTLRFTVRGLEAHAGVAPERGISAIKVAAEAIARMRLGRIDEETTANLGAIGGGGPINVVPRECVVRGEARSRNPEKLAAQVRHMLECFKDAVAQAEILVDGKLFKASLDYEATPQYEPLNIAEDSPIVKKVIEAARRAGFEVKPEATGGGSDANVFNQRGLTVANLGTGMHDIHTVREWLNLREMSSTAQVALEFVKLWAGA
jgi:tripeptide aminopeptidase